MRRLLPFLIAALFLAIIAVPWIAHLRAQTRPHHLTVSTGQLRAVYHPLAEAITAAVNRDHPRLTFSLTPSDGSVMSMRRLHDGDAHLALLQNGTPGGPHVRVVAPLYDEVLHILVPADSDALSIRDLRGGRLAVGPSESGTRQVVDRLFAHYGLDVGEYEPFHNDIAVSCQQLLDNQLDAVFAVTGVHGDALRDTLATGDVRLLGIGEPGTAGGEVEALRLHHPDLHPYVLPTNTYPDADETLPGHPRNAVQTVAVPSLLVCRADLPDAVVNDITTSLFANRTTLVRDQPAAASIREPSDPAAYSYPVHPGADAYVHRHDPGFLVTYAEVIALVITLAITLWGAVAAVHRWLGLKKKDRIDTYYVQIEELLAHLHEHPDLSVDELRSMDEELAALRHQAVQELVAERLQANESFRIFQTLLSNSRNDVRRRLDRIT